MTPEQAVKRARRFKPGDRVEVVWLDSGREHHDPRQGLVRGRCFGQVHALRGDELVLAMDVSEDATGENVDGGSDTYGVIWIPAIREAYKLRRC